MTATAETLNPDGIQDEFTPVLAELALEKSPGLRIVEVADEGEEVLPPSRAVTLDIPIRYLNTFSQVRPGKNDQQTALKESLRTRQIHPISVVLADEALAVEYLEFTNSTWGSDKKPEELVAVPSGQYAGKYVIVIAGHSRTLGYQDLAVDAGYKPGDAVIEARVFDVKDIDEMLEIQMAENTGSQPPELRSFHAIAEMYLRLQSRQPGHPIDRKSFARYYKFSEGKLRDALNYVMLPTEIRELADRGVINEHIAIELARARGAIVYHATKLADKDERFFIPRGAENEAIKDILAVKDEAIRKQTSYEIYALISTLDRAGVTNLERITTGRRIIRAHAKELRTRYRTTKAAEVSILDMMDPMFELEETLESRFNRFYGEVSRNLEMFANIDGARQRWLARSLTELASLAIKVSSGQLVLQAAELTAARLRFAADEESKVTKTKQRAP